MSGPIGDTLPFAIGIAISPIPIIAVILMLFSTRARQNGPAFFAGWVLGVFAVTAAFAFVLNTAGADSDEGTNDLVDWLKLLLGLVLLFLALKQWQARPAAGEELAMPGWMSSVEEFTPAKAFGIAVILAAVNPKNLILAGGAGATIGQTPGLSTGEAIVDVLVFTAIASVTTGGAVIYYLVGGEGAKSTLDTFKAWLIQNNATIMTVLLLVLGFALAGQAISGLAD